ncbi:MAG: tRNA threonylcarbamoyladenosine biosynthesis protein TsaB [Chloroflexota bacterium]|nr:tRNA threonylcarbamoyladenosine biosynthesis protein TsaB [Chloroflexota bacterium]
MILAIDTSTQWMGIALLQDAQILYEKVWRTKRRHTVELAPAIQSAMDDCGLRVGDLEAVGVALGPGSFTSLRIGLAVAKGLALTQRVPVIGVPSLDITAAGLPVQDKLLIAVLRAGRERLAACHYRVQEGRWQADGDIFITTAQELEAAIDSPTLVCGEIEPEERRILERRWRNALLPDAADCMRRPARLAVMSAERFQAGKFDDAVSLAPIYLHTLNTPALNQD